MEKKTYIYKIVAYDIVDEIECNSVEYVTSDKLYDIDEFKNICNKCIEEVRKISKEVSYYTVKQRLLLHYGFKDLEVIQTFTFDEEYN